MIVERGNHKSTKKNDKTLNKAFTNEIQKDWLLPITVESITKIKGLSIIPLGVAEQLTIDENGYRVPKPRVTHDDSFPTLSRISVNNKIIKALPHDYIYGQCLRRILHGIHALRYKHPNKMLLTGDCTR